MYTEIEISADGATLAGRRYDAEEPVATLLIHGATGVPQSYYAAFAEWAVSQGRQVITYDYRDSGASLSGSVRDSDATFRDYGLFDQAAALEYAFDNAGDKPLHVIGHSIGGFMTPFHDHAERIDAMTTVASGEPYHWRHPLRYTPLVLLFWFLLGPLATLICGYLPGRMLGFGADLPSGVYWGWRRWCTSREFYTKDIGRTLPQPMDPGLSAPLIIIGFSDDQMMPPAAVARLARRYPNAQITETMVEPRGRDLPPIGHLGAFRKRASNIWPLILPEAENLLVHNR